MSVAYPGARLFYRPTSSQHTRRTSCTLLDFSGNSHSKRGRTGIRPGENDSRIIRTLDCLQFAALRNRIDLERSKWEEGTSRFQQSEGNLISPLSSHHPI